MNPIKNTVAIITINWVINNNFLFHPLASGPTLVNQKTDNNLLHLLKGLFDVVLKVIKLNIYITIY